MPRIAILKLVVFLSAFLLFQLELIAGKAVLPLYGGSYLVWGACVVFFQAVLLAGYCFAYYVLPRLTFARYRFIHLGLFVLPFLFFPGHILSFQPLSRNLPLVWDVFCSLARAIGPAFFILSTMSVLWQAWLANSNLPEKENPYSLFAFSNAGSLLALLSYPLVFELFLGLKAQETIWRWLYGILFLLQVLAFAVIRFENQSREEISNAPNSTFSIKAAWFLYGSAGSVLFLAVTNIITAKISPVPLLWVLPLSIYLLTFCLAYKPNPVAPRWADGPPYRLMLAGMVVYYFTQMWFWTLWIGVAVFLMYFYFIGLYCQTRLFAVRPTDKNQLPLYYCLMAAGGLVGGVWVSWLMPLISISFIELFLGILLCYSGWLVEKSTAVSGQELRNGFLRWICFASLGFVFFPALGLVEITLSALILSLLLPVLWGKGKFLTISILLVLAIGMSGDSAWGGKKNIYKGRSFYGMSSVWEAGGLRHFVHGSIVHGLEFTNPSLKVVPLAYFSADGPFGELMMSPPIAVHSIASLGLGVGSFASYISSDQIVDSFELDKDVIDIAVRYFSFLKNTKTNVTHYVGDARVSLAERPPQNYDLIIVDTFSGDAIPTHLLTLEAFQEYRRHLNKEGFILLNLSNRFIDCRPLVAGAGSRLGGRVCFKKWEGNGTETYSSEWAVVTFDEKVFERLVKEKGWEPLTGENRQPNLFWTDDQSSLLPYLRSHKYWRVLGQIFLGRKSAGGESP